MPRKSLDPLCVLFKWRPVSCTSFHQTCIIAYVGTSIASVLVLRACDRTYVPLNTGPVDAEDNGDDDADGAGSKKRKQAQQTLSLGDVGPALSAFAEVICVLSLLVCMYM